ncbi:hypothetical protein BGY98DRAFT_1012989 [Russula aff. rugulosa BPL654]|nr:hypothetical protein BGY98DRAFT_1012989 [Russula aff. rugulosa BPL654]
MAGIVGFHNVGKSSLFSKLKRAKVCRCGEGVCRCGAAGTHEGVVVNSTRARPAVRRLARGQKGSSVLLRNVVKPKTSSRQRPNLRSRKIGEDL